MWVFERRLGESRSSLAEPARLDVKPESPLRHSLFGQKHCIAVAEETIAVFNCDAVSVSDSLNARKRRDQHNQR